MTAQHAEAEHLRSTLENGVLRLTLNRPDRMNAFAGSMRDDLANAVAAAAGNRAVRAIVISGAGKAFCAGADVAAMAEMLDRSDEEAFSRNVEAGVRAVLAIAGAPQPVIAAINGVAVGAGAALAIACDIRIASDAARVGFTFNRIGLHPDWGASHNLPRLVGAGRAAELIASARLLGAAEAERIGLVERVVPAAEFDEAVSNYAAMLAAKPPQALAQAKRSLAAEHEDALSRALRREADAQLRCFRTADVREGIAAFHEKREPVFTGR